MQPIYVSFHTTDPGYTAEANALAATLDAHGLPFDIVPVPPFVSWAAACQYKATFIANMLRNWAGRPLVWLDADARVMQPPSLFDELDCDFAANWLGDTQLNAATLYFAPTAAASRLVAKWKQRNTDNPNGQHGDQQNLQDVVESFADLRIHRLPPEYAWIDAGGGVDISERHYGKRQPVIVQTQASRRHK